MSYTLKAILMISFVFVSMSTHKDISCEELMENIIYEGVFFGGLNEHDLNSPFLNDVTAYIYQENIYVITTDSRERTEIYCEVEKEDWAAFEEPCNCSYSKKFAAHIRKFECDCTLD